MAFDIVISTTNECDKCDKLGSESNPVLEIFFRTGRGNEQDRNLIFVCWSCLSKTWEKWRLKQIATNFGRTVDGPQIDKPVKPV